MSFCHFYHAFYVLFSPLLFVVYLPQSEISALTKFLKSFAIYEPVNQLIVRSVPAHLTTRSDTVESH